MEKPSGKETSANLMFIDLVQLFERAGNLDQAMGLVSLSVNPLSRLPHLLGEILRPRQDTL
jgi:hypothetical protein